MSRNPHEIIKAPVITEESTIQSETRNQYVFRVDPCANKPEIRDAIERLFNVRVVSVNTCNYAGKRRRRGLQYGRTANWKKAVVTLHEGDSIDLI
jgi:large subunit ribosomal protein L23